MTGMEWMLLITFVIGSTAVHLTILRYLRNDAHLGIEARAWQQHRQEMSRK